MIFYLMAVNSMMMEFQIHISNSSLQVILNDHYINKEENGVAQIIGMQQAVNEMQQNLMG